MSNDWEDRVIRKGFEGAGNIFAAIVGIAIAGGVQAVSSSLQVDSAQQLRAMQTPLENGIAIQELTCPACTSINESGQIECYKCGAELLQTHKKTHAPTNLIPVLPHGLTCIGLILLGILIAAWSGGNNRLVQVGISVFLIGFIWSLFLGLMVWNEQGR